jgi:hypothetical protein
VLRSLEAAAGLIVLAAVLYDLFHSVVMPRPSVGRLRLAPLILRPLWRGWRLAGSRMTRLQRRERWLGTFGPFALIALLGFWVSSVTLGYALLVDAVADQLQPAPGDLWESLYFSASTLFPLSYGDVLPMGAAARAIVVAEAATGIALIALVISLLFSLYRSVQDREEKVVTLDALAGAPPSGIHMLETAATLHMPDVLQTTFDDWRGWAAAVLESHLAYPILVYFRSSHDNEAWLNSFGAVMDAAVLVISTIDVEGPLEGHARLLFKVGNHLVEDLAWYFHLEFSSAPVVERQEFELARDRLLRAGYRCRDDEASWQQFSSLRSMYALPLNQLARNLAVIPAEWIGDRSYLPHAEKRR